MMSHWLDDVFNNSVRNNFINNGINTFTCMPSNSFPWKFKSNLPCKYPLPWELEIKKVIFNGPATVVLWNDGTKTVVKCAENEEFDPEKGVAMCIWKKFLPKQYGRKAERIINNTRKQANKSCFYCKHFDSLSCLGCAKMCHYEER